MKNALLVLLALLGAIGTLANATVIGTWNGSASGRTLNDPDFLGTKTMFGSLGFTVAPNSAIDAQALALACVLFINEAPLAPSASELDMLETWVTDGGILVVTGDSGGVGVSAANSIFSGLGLSLALSAVAPTQVSPAISASPFSSGLVGELLAISPAATVTGGSVVAGDYIHFEALGGGFVLAFGDASYHPVLGGEDETSTNGNLLVSICLTAECTQSSGNGGTVPGGNNVPESWTAVTAATGVAVIAIKRRRKFRLAR